MKINKREWVKLQKISDEVFNGRHPNYIYEGYIQYGTLENEVTVGERCYVVNHCRYDDYLSTSKVTEIIDDNTFRTENSIYKIEVVLKEVIKMDANRVMITGGRMDANIIIISEELYLEWVETGGCLVTDEEKIITEEERFEAVKKELETYYPNETFEEEDIDQYFIDNIQNFSLTINEFTDLVDGDFLTYTSASGDKIVIIVFEWN